MLSLAEHHGVIPLVAGTLLENQHAGQDTQAADLQLPVEIARSLRAAYDANLRRNLWFTAELARIVHHFERRQLRVLPYKGPVLAQSLYGDLGRRSFSDLDLLISPANFERATQALSEIDYHPASDLSPAVERMWLRTGYECSFNGAAGKHLVELQWSLLSHFYAVDFRQADLRVEDLQQRAGTILLGGCAMPCLSPEDSLLAQCLHSAKHLWTRLIWLADIDATLRLPGLDYAQTFARARRAGIARILGISFWLVRNVLGGSLPRPAEDMIAADPQIAVLGREFAERLARGALYDFESTEYFRLILKLRERRSDHCRYLWRLIWTPGISDVESVNLPELFFPLYRIVRLARLTRKFLL